MENPNLRSPRVNPKLEKPNEECLGKSLLTKLTEYFVLSGLYFSITSASQTVSFQTVQPHERKNNCAFILFPKKG